MLDETKPVAPPAAPENQFQEQANQQSVGIIREFVDFLRYNKAWWLTPIVVVLLMVGSLMFLAATGAAPFIYTIF